jgi:hypothetical protein
LHNKRGRENVTDALVAKLDAVLVVEFAAENAELTVAGAVDNFIIYNLSLKSNL